MWAVRDEEKSDALLIPPKIVGGPEDGEEASIARKVHIFVNLEFALKNC